MHRVDRWEETTTAEVVSLESVKDVLQALDRAGHLVPATNGQIPMLQHYWVTAFVRHYGATRRLAFTCVLRAGKITTLMPAQLSEDGTVLEFSCDETADFTDFFVGAQSDTDVEPIFDYWRARGVKTCSLARLPLTSATIGRLSRYAATRGQTLRLGVSEVAPYVRLDAELSVLERRIASSQTIRRYANRRAALGKRVAVEFLLEGSRFMDVWPEVRAIHVARWAEKGVASKYADPRRAAFIEEICRQAAARGELFVPLLRFDGQIAAFIIGFHTLNRVFDWNTGFDPQYKRQSLGALLLLEAISRAQAMGATRYDLLEGCDEHKFVWASDYDGSAVLTMNL